MLTFKIYPLCFDIGEDVSRWIYLVTLVIQAALPQFPIDQEVWEEQRTSVSYRSGSLGGAAQ